jgi:hypothetical protein
MLKFIGQSVFYGCYQLENKQCWLPRLF